MLEPSKYVKQIDPTIALDDKYIKLRLEEGAETVTYTKFPSSSVSTNNIQFNNINPPNATTVVDRRFWVRMPFRLTFTGTNVPIGEFLLATSDSVNGTGDLVGQDAPRAYPLSQIIQSLSVKLNSQTFTQTLNDYIEPLLRYSNHRDTAEMDWSKTPSMPDMYKQYGDFNIYGGAKNALGNYGDSQYYTPRGGFGNMTVVSQNIVGQPAGTPSSDLADIMQAVVDIEVCEPIFISPLAFGRRTRRGFVGLTTTQLTLNISPNYADYVWSHDTTSGKVISNIALSFDTTTQGMASRPEAMFTYLTPRMELAIPRDNLYSYHDINDYTIEAGGAVQPGASQTFSVSNIQLDSVPKRVYIFLKKRPADKTFNDTDTYARITGLSMNFANISGLFSDANEQQLYQMSVDNGCLLSYTQWMKHVGSVMCIDFARQVSMDHRNIVGKSGSYQLQYKVDVQNISDEAQIYEINTVVVSDGYILIADQSIDRHSNLGDIDKVYDSPQIHVVDWESFDDFYGAGFSDRLRSILNKGKDFAVKLGKDLLDKYGPEVKRLAKEAAKRYGPEVVNMIISEIPIAGPEAGLAAEEALRRLLGSGVVGGAGMYFGDGVVGGKQVGRKAMKQKLLRY